MTETLANGYSYESIQRELLNEYQHDRVSMVFENLCVLVLGTKVASAVKGLILKRFGIAANFTLLRLDAEMVEIVLISLALHVENSENYLQ